MSFRVISQYKKEYSIADDTVNDRLGNYTYNSEKGGKPAFSKGKYYIFYDSDYGWQWGTSFEPNFSLNYELKTAEEFASFMGFETSNIPAPFVITSQIWSEIYENIGTEQIIYTITTSYKSNVTYGISGADVNNFSVNSETGQVTLTDNPDYEIKHWYDFTVSATTGDGEKISEPIGLYINNVDEKPIITSGSEGIDIVENSDSGQTVYTITATDDFFSTRYGGADFFSARSEGVDYPERNTITYELSGTDATFLNLNSSTGEVTLNISPDYEDKSTYTFDVIAIDYADNKSDPKTVTFNIINVDDTKPEITLNGTNPTNLAFGKEYIELATANDNKDGDISDKIIISGDVVNTDIIGTYTVKYDVSDAAGNKAYQVERIVYVIDDTKPIIIGPSESPGAATSSKSINENTRAVHTFTANELVTWSLNGGEDASKFSIDPDTGTLSFIDAPDYENTTDADSNNDYVVIVKATDTADNTSDQTVTVIVDDINQTTILNFNSFGFFRTYPEYTNNINKLISEYYDNANDGEMYDLPWFKAFLIKYGINNSWAKIGKKDTSSSMTSTNLIATSKVEQKTLYYEINAKLSKQDIINGETIAKKISDKDDDILQSLSTEIEKTIDYKIPIEDYKNTNIEFTSNSNFTIVTLNIIDVNVNKGWNLIGSSYDASINDPDNIIIQNTIYEFDTSYKNSSQIKKNKGYWIKCNNAGAFQINYTNNDIIYEWTEFGIEKIQENSDLYIKLNSPKVKDQLDNFNFVDLLQINYTTESLLEQKMIKIKDNEITLNEGWNLGGSSYNSTIEDPDSIIVPNTIYEYNTSYKSTTEIKENKGYWIKASKSGKIILKIN